ncbi:MAG: PD40 domain-containing protein [Chloroflexi bacterium]|nr:PD40 domain-containing protein [Chloroflexota bacterium]
MFTGIDGVNNPRWSPDGAWIAFSYEPPQDDTRHLYMVAADGGEPILLTDQDGWQDQAVWSPDSQRIAYNHYPAAPNSRPDVAVVDIETRITLVTRHPQTDTDPRWSPDGRSLAFVSDRYDVRPRLHVVPADRLDAVEPISVPGIAMRLYAYAWRP